MRTHSRFLTLSAHFSPAHRLARLHAHTSTCWPEYVRYNGAHVFLGCSLISLPATATGPVQGARSQQQEVLRQVCLLGEAVRSALCQRMASLHHFPTASPVVARCSFFLQSPTLACRVYSSHSLHSFAREADNLFACLSRGLLIVAGTHTTLCTGHDCRTSTRRSMASGSALHASVSIAVGSLATTT